VAGVPIWRVIQPGAQADRLGQQGATPVEVSLFDVKGLTEAFAGCDVVINLATAIPPDAAAHERPGVGSQIAALPDLGESPAAAGLIPAAAPLLQRRAVSRSRLAKRARCPDLDVQRLVRHRSDVRA